MIEDISSIVPAERIPILTAHLERLDESIEAFFPPADHKLASGRDYQGLGSSRDPVSRRELRKTTVTPPVGS